jgi:hypothetical protein
MAFRPNKQTSKRQAEQQQNSSRQTHPANALLQKLAKKKQQAKTSSTNAITAGGSTHEIRPLRPPLIQFSPPFINSNIISSFQEHSSTQNNQTQNGKKQTDVHKSQYNPSHQVQRIARNNNRVQRVNNTRIKWQT